MTECLVGVGANLADPTDTFLALLREIRARDEPRLVRHGRWRTTAPVGGPPGQEPYRNGALLLETTRGARELFEYLGRLEKRLGRRRGPRWGPRVIDLDLLLFGQLVLREPDLTIPHPRMVFRRFVLEPAAEIAPDMVHPTSGWTVRQLCEHLDHRPDYIALTGGSRTARSAIADDVARRVGGQSIRDPSAGGPPERDASKSARRAESPLSDELERLRRRADPLRRDLWIERDMPIISDFCIETSLVAAKSRLGHDDARRLERRWGELRASVVSPKLLVVLSGGEGERPGSGVPDVSSAPPIRPFPEFRLDSADPDEVSDEIVAALLAMR